MRWVLHADASNGFASSRSVSWPLQSEHTEDAVVAGADSHHA